MNKFIYCLLLAGITAIGCATPKRIVTTGKWLSTNNNHSFYLGYWEGKCRAVLGCERGDAHLKGCKLAEDNGLECENQESIDKLLNN